MSTPYAESYKAASAHAKGFLQTTIGAHPGTAAIIMAVLILLVIIVGYKAYEYKAKCTKSGFVSPVNNLTTGNNNPLWQLGAMDAGNYGPMHRDATAWNVAAYHPGWRPGDGATPFGREASFGREGMANPGYGAGAGGAIYNRPGPPSVCGRGWDPAASAEAEALATVGALQHESFGEHRLQSAVGAAYDSGLGMSDEQLQLLIHQGGTP